MRTILVSLVARARSSRARPAADAPAVPGPGPQELIEKVSQDLLHEIDANRAALAKDPAKLRALVDRVLLPNFDADYSARLVLGKYWRTATEQQRQRFIDAFIQSMMRKYGNALLDFTADRLVILPFKGDPGGGPRHGAHRGEAGQWHAGAGELFPARDAAGLEGLGRDHRGHFLRQEFPDRFRFGDRGQGARCGDPAARVRKPRTDAQGGRHGGLNVPEFVIERVAPDRLRATGELDFLTATDALRAGIDQIGRDGEQVVDLSGVTAGDSAGVAVLVEWISIAAAAGMGLRYENVPPQMLAIARISDLEDLLMRS